jgi:hypothetical protein
MKHVSIARLALVLVAAVGVGRAFALPKPVRDAENSVIGYVDAQGEKTFVRDCTYKLLGYTDPSGTYDADGKKLSDQSVPDLLLERSVCKGTSKH